MSECLRRSPCIFILPPDGLDSSLSHLRASSFARLLLTSLDSPTFPLSLLPLLFLYLLSPHHLD